MKPLSACRVLFVGMGGLGCPAALALDGSGVGTFRIADDDNVSISNLHRQILFDEQDCGRPKVEVAQERLNGQRIEALAQRFLPESADALLQDVDLVIEGSDNYATKFLVADACQRAKIPAVHGGAIRWNGWALAVPMSTDHAPCLRCLFEEIPSGAQTNCDIAGIVGPVAGVIGSTMALLALSLLEGSELPHFWHYRGQEGLLRKRKPPRRSDCPHGAGR